MSLEPDLNDLNSNSSQVSKSQGSEDENADDELQCLGTQIGGHSSLIEKYKKTKLGIYDLKNGLILKTLFPPPRGPRELKFYQTVFSRDCCDMDLIELRPFIPTFFGTEEKINSTMLKLANLTAPFKKPCVMDVKMGRVTYDQEATAQKIHAEEIKFPPLKKTGFQITGMIIQNQSEKKVIDKYYTRSLTEKTLVTDGIDVFFSVLNKKVKKQVIWGLVSRLKKLERWFLKQKKFSFTASSLLFIYEGKNGSALVSPSMNENSDIACKRVEETDSISGRTPKESSNCFSGSIGGNRKRLHDHDNTNSNNNDCDVQNECGTGNKVLKKNPSAARNADAVQSGSSDQETELTTPVIHHVTTNPAGDSSEGETNGDVPEFSVHLIDFAHVFPTSDVDENFLFGLQNLIKSLVMLCE